MEVGAAGMRSALVVVLVALLTTGCLTNAQQAPTLAPTLAPTANPSPTPSSSPRPSPKASPQPSPNVPPAETPPIEPGGTVRLMAIGDVMLAQSIGRRIIKRGPSAPWQRVKPLFDQADLVVANLECTISTRGTAANKTFTFRAPPAAADSLVAAGIDVVSLANNHALDYGISAFEDTLGLLEERAIGYAGGGRDAAAAHAAMIVEQNGLRLAFLGYVLPFSGRTRFNTRQWEAGANRPGLAIGTPDAVAADVTAARLNADLVIVMVHGGTEYSHRPIAKQRNFAKAAVDAGATLVIGHHPHVLQGYERRAGTLIAYSLGNFVFDYFSGDMNDTAIMDVTLSINGVESLKWIPVVIQNGFPRPAVGAEIARIMARLKPLPPP